MRYTSKKDFVGKVIGLEQYKPGDPSMQNLGIRVTSGTTAGDLTMIIWGFDERLPFHWAFWDSEYGNHLRFIGKNAPNTPSVNYLLRNTSVNKVLCLDKKDIDHHDLPRMLEDFAPTSLYAYVGMLNTLLSKIKALGKEGLLRGIRVLGLGGGALGAITERKVNDCMPDVDIRSGYALAEAQDWLVRNCKHLEQKYPDHRRNVFHPQQELHVIEPDADGIGEIVITTPQVGHYRTGDAGKLIDETCPCGQTQTFIVYGRRDYDIVYCAGAMFLRSEIERCFEPFAGTIADYKVVVEERAGDDGKTIGIVSFLVVPQQGHGDLEEIRRNIDAISARLFVTKTRTLAKLIQEQVFMPSEIHIVEVIESSGNKKVRLQKKT